MKVYIAKDGTPVVVWARDYRKSHRFCGRKPKKEELRRKGLLGKIPKSEMMLLTMRQRAALKNFVEAGLDPSKKAACAVAAGYSPTHQGQPIDNVLSKPFIRQRIAEALEKAGVSYDKIATVIAEGLEAEHPTADRRFDPATGELYGNGKLNSQGHGEQISHGRGKQKSHAPGKWNSHSLGTPVRLGKTLQERE